MLMLPLPPLPACSPVPLSPSSFWGLGFWVGFAVLCRHIHWESIPLRKKRAGFGNAGQPHTVVNPVDPQELGGFGDAGADNSDSELVVRRTTWSEIYDDVPHRLGNHFGPFIARLLPVCQLHPHPHARRMSKKKVCLNDD